MFHIQWKKRCKQTNWTIFWQFHISMLWSGLVLKLKSWFNHVWVRGQTRTGQENRHRRMVSLGACVVFQQEIRAGCCTAELRPAKPAACGAVLPFWRSPGWARGWAPARRTGTPPAVACWAGRPAGFFPPWKPHGREGKRGQWVSASQFNQAAGGGAHLHTSKCTSTT